MKLYIVVVLICTVYSTYGEKEHTEHHPGDQKHQTEGGDHNEHFDHEAVIGSRQEEKEFDELEPEEAKRRLSKMVSEHDLNQDKAIDREEFTKWILESFKKLDTEEAEERFKEEDTDKDGELSWRELVKTRYSYDLEDVEDFNKQIDKQDAEMKEFLKMIVDEEEKFNTADTDSNGNLNLKEYTAYYHPNEYPHMHDVEIKRALKETDKNGDGLISKEEYIGENRDRESYIVEEETFRSFDKNSDGKLDKNEIKGWVIQDNQLATKEEVDHLFSIADENKNEELALDEILKHHDEFVGSAATDYGRRLEDEL